MDSGIQSEQVSACSTLDEAQAVLPGGSSASPAEQYFKSNEFFSITQIQEKDIPYVTHWSLMHRHSVNSPMLRK